MANVVAISWSWSPSVGGGRPKVEIAIDLCAREWEVGIANDDTLVIKPLAPWVVFPRDPCCKDLSDRLPSVAAVPLKDPWKNPPRVIDPSPLHLLCRSAPKNPKRSKPRDAAPTFSLSKHPKKFEARKQCDLESMDAQSPPPIPATPSSPMLQIILVHQTLKERSTKWPFYSIAATLQRANNPYNS